MLPLSATPRAHKQTLLSLPRQSRASSKARALPEQLWLLLLLSCLHKRMHRCCSHWVSSACFRHPFPRDSSRHSEDQLRMMRSIIRPIKTLTTILLLAPRGKKQKSTLGTEATTRRCEPWPPLPRCHASSNYNADAGPRFLPALKGRRSIIEALDELCIGRTGHRIAKWHKLRHAVSNVRYSIRKNRHTAMLDHCSQREESF